MNGHATHRAARIFSRVAVCAACLAGASLACGATPDDCHALRKHGHRAEAQKCYESLTHRARSVPARRRLLGHGNVSGGEQPVSHRGGRNRPRTPCIACAGAA